jgi:hypothetical protein
VNAIISFLLLALQQATKVILTDPAATTFIVQTLGSAVPLLIQEASDLVPIVQGIIKDMMSSGGVTDADMVTLQMLDKQCDDAFDAAVAAKDAEV